MSIDKSLRRKDTLARARSVLTRGERILTLQKEEKWQEGRSPFGLPKVRVLKIAKKPKKAAKEEPKEGEEAAAATAEAAAATPAAVPTDKKGATEKKAPADKKAATEKKK